MSSASFLRAAASRAADAAADEAPSAAPHATTTTTETQAQVTLDSADGEEVAWPRAAAESCGALVDWLSEAGGDGGAFFVSAPAAALRTLARHLDEGAAALQGCTLAQLAHVVQAAHFLEADAAARRDISHALCERFLDGKSPEELIGLLGASCDYESAAAQRAAVAEPAFEPDAVDAPVAPAAIPTPPAVTRSLSTELINEDAAEAALAEADVPTLCALKGVSTAWRARARRVLCARLCASDSQPLPTSRDEVSDLDLGPMLGVGRLSDAAAAGRLLPNLAGVRARGFTMDVAAARATSAAMTEDGWVPRRPASFFEPGGLRGCIRGEGQPPADVLLGMCAVRDGEAHVAPYAFYGCSSLALTALPDGLTSIGDYAFYGCSLPALTALPDGLTSIGDHAFDGCSSLALTALPDGLTSIGNRAFCGSSLPAPAPATGALFTFSLPAPAPATGALFTFSQPAPVPAAGGLFTFSQRAPAPAAGGVLTPFQFGSGGTTPAGGGLIGAAATVSTTPGSTPFGGSAAPAPAPGGLFGGAAVPAPEADGP